MLTHLRELEKKASTIKRVGKAIDFGTNPSTRYTLIFENEADAILYEALRNAAPFLLAVAEAGDLMWSELVEYQSFNSVENWRQLICAGKKYDEAREALRALKEATP